MHESKHSSAVAQSWSIQCVLHYWPPSLLSGSLSFRLGNKTTKKLHKKNLNQCTNKISSKQFLVNYDKTSNLLIILIDRFSPPVLTKPMTSVLWLNITASKKLGNCWETQNKSNSLSWLYYKYSFPHPLHFKSSLITVIKILKCMWCLLYLDGSSFHKNICSNFTPVCTWMKKHVE